MLLKKLFARPTPRIRKQKRSAVLAVEQLETRDCPSTTTVAPYLIPSAVGVSITPILTTGDTVPKAGGGDFRMVGIPDGLGAFDNGNGTFTVLMNHELGSTVGDVRSHGSKGAFVSRFVIDKATLNVLSGEDQIKHIFQWNGSAYTELTTALNRLCSADLPATSGLYNPATGLGTQERMFLDGEEFADGRAWAHILTGPDTGNSYQLARLGRYAYENVLVNPFSQDKTIVATTDDSNRLFASEGAADPSEVYFYIGTKTATGSAIDRAGLTNGFLHGLQVAATDADGIAQNEGQVVSGARFTLVNLGDVSRLSTGTGAGSLEALSKSNNITQFRRPEDGVWDPQHPNIFYFNTTDGFGLSSRLWRVTFDDVTHPELGGKIEIVVDDANPQIPIEMFDNLTMDPSGRIVECEDVGNNAHIGKVWMYDSTSGGVLQIAQHDPTFFSGSSATNPNFLTQDEESSGVIDVSSIFGEGYYLIDVQAHFAINNTTPHGFANPNELVEGGQLLLIHVGATAGFGFDSATGNPALVALGTSGNDHIEIQQSGQHFTVKVGNQVLFDATAVSAIDKVFAVGYDGNDHIDLSGVQARSYIYGGDGNDHLEGGSGDDYLNGGAGNDHLAGNAGKDTMEGGAGNDHFDLNGADILLDFGVGNDNKKK